MTINPLKQMLWGLSKKDRRLVKVEACRANLQRIRNVNLVSLLLTAVFGVGLDLLEFAKDSGQNPHIRILFTVHLALVVFFSVSFFIVRLFTPLAARWGQATEGLAGCKAFQVVYAIGYISIANCLNLGQVFNSSVLLIYLMTLTLLSAFLLFSARWLAIIYAVGLLQVVFILFFSPITNGNDTSAAAVTLLATVSNFVLAWLLYLNFGRQVLHRLTIEQQQAHLQESHIDRHHILSVVAHDLRTPVVNIDQLAAMVQAGKQPGTDEAKMLELIRESCHQAYQIIDDLIASRDGRLNGKQMQLADIQPVFKEVLAVNHNRLTSKGLQVEVEECAAPLNVYLNTAGFKRVFENLLTNAIKFTPRNGRLKIHFGKKGQHAIISIADSGIGIPANMTPHLFKPFTRARRKGTDGENTTGLGLSIVKDIVENHGGSIQVASNEGQGTTFTITLPLAG